MILFYYSMQDTLYFPQCDCLLSKMKQNVFDKVNSKMFRCVQNILKEDMFFIFAKIVYRLQPTIGKFKINIVVSYLKISINTHPLFDALFIPQLGPLIHDLISNK